MDKLNEITTEDLFMTKEEALEWADWTENTIYDKGIKIGITQGRIEGITQGKIEGNQETTEKHIKSMVDNNIDLDTISKITNKTIEEIKEIINKN